MVGGKIAHFLKTKDRTFTPFFKLGVKYCLKPAFHLFSLIDEVSNHHFLSKIVDAV